MIDTIVAVSTSFVPSAIGLIRLSGTKVLEISEKVLFKNEKFFSREYLQENKRVAIYCDFADGENKLDQIIYTFFESPNSYTGEDLAEFSFHGNPILLRNCLEVFFRLGARPAKEGEFTKRAFLNQKLDLSKAEAIGRFIGARSNLELELAKKNVYGEISRLSSRLRSDLISLKAECEAEIDFSTEDLTYESLEERKSRMMNVIKLCSNTLEHSKRADTAIEETSVVIYGEPNSGKSSLLNMMLGKERAIVSDIPGTTRDFLKESLNLDGIPIQLIDTAGVRETEDTVEKLGIERSKSEFSKAKIKLFLFDASLDYDIENFINLHKEKLEHSILLANKIDIHNANFAEYKKKLLPFVIDSLEISCKERKGITELVQLISDKIQTETTKEDFIFLEDRNKFHFQSILSSLQKSVELLENSAPAEIYIKEIDYALAAVGEINGRVETEEVLGRIFSKFCVGK